MEAIFSQDWFQKRARRWDSLGNPNAALFPVYESLCEKAEY